MNQYKNLGENAYFKVFFLIMMLKYTIFIKNIYYHKKNYK